MHFLSMINITT